jgi:hypothetical protein
MSHEDFPEEQKYRSNLNPDESTLIINPSWLL